jgi:CDP-diacylglycerol--glycerol-3-phosphate 3-phosphatidyltransferase
MNVANLITVLRFPLLVVVVLLLYFGGTVGQLIDAPLIVALILMDSLDGIVARRRDEQTLIGSALDIAADRAVEIVLWVTYAHLRLISVVVPSWSRWLVASGAMRAGYGVAKAVAFTLLALALGLKTGRHAAWHGVWLVASVISWIALALCIVRGLPVLIEVRRLFQSAEFQVAAPPVSRD